MVRFRRYFDSETRWAPLVLRPVLGGVFLALGARKALG